MSFRKYFNYKNYLRYLLKVLERRRIGQGVEVEAPQFLITGLPRTGTTLVYQYIVHRLHIAYFPNKVGDYYETPCTITALSKRFFSPYCSDFQSRYGKVSGVMAPREAGAFWLRFFDIHHYIDHTQVESRDVEIIRRTIACIQHIFGDVPFVNKNVKHMLRIDALKMIFPGVVFIIVERDLADVALSIWEARQKNFGDVSNWWSVRPSNYEQLKILPPVEQVAFQVTALQERLKQDLSAFPAESLLYLHYQDFCRNPEGIIQRIKERFPLIEEKNPAAAAFKYSCKTVSTIEEEQLVQKIKQLLPSQG